jgi:lysozyme family protein
LIATSYQKWRVLAALLLTITNAAGNSSVHKNLPFQQPLIKTTCEDSVIREIKRTILKHEGCEYSDDSDDPGKATKFGISQAQYPHLDIQHLMLEEAVAIYVRDYWDPLRCSEISDVRLRWKVFDIAVNQGVVRAAMFLQRAAGVVVDGLVGNQTLETVNRLDPKDLILKLTWEQQNRYASIVQARPVMVKFLRGWITRSQDLGQGIEDEEDKL